MAVTEYCLHAITQQLADDDLLEEEHVILPVKPTKDEDLIADLRVLQEKIKTRRGGKPIDIDRILEKMRDERDYELLGLR